MYGHGHEGICVCIAGAGLEVLPWVVSGGAPHQRFVNRRRVRDTPGRYVTAGAPPHDGGLQANQYTRLLITISRLAEA